VPEEPERAVDLMALLLYVSPYYGLVSNTSSLVPYC
jgi:hypothetical protein